MGDEEMIPLLSRIWSLITASKFLFLLVRHYVVLKDAFTGIESVLTNMTKDARALPTHEETQILCVSVSNILKTGVIDLPGVDEYQLAIGLDNIQANMVLSIQDKKSGKYHTIPVLKKGKSA